MVLASAGTEAPVKEYTPQLCKIGTKSAITKNMNDFFIINSLSISLKYTDRFN